MNKSDLSFLTYRMGVIMSTIANQYKIKLNKYIQNTKNRTWHKVITSEVGFFPPKNRFLLQMLTYFDQSPWVNYRSLE